MPTFDFPMLAWWGLPLAAAPLVIHLITRLRHARVPFAALEFLVASRRRHRARGQVLDAAGSGVLVGVATVPPSGDAWLDRFLGLPDEALAVLRCRITAEPKAAA